MDGRTDGRTDGCTDRHLDTFGLLSEPKIPFWQSLEYLFLSSRCMSLSFSFVCSLARGDWRAGGVYSWVASHQASIQSDAVSQILCDGLRIVDSTKNNVKKALQKLFFKNILSLNKKIDPYVEYINDKGGRSFGNLLSSPGPSPSPSPCPNRPPSWIWTLGWHYFHTGHHPTL